jgi:transposase-like protein
MLLSATPEEIKAYQMKLDNDEIRPDDLPACPRCHVESAFFKEYAYRERIFLVIVDSVVKTASSALVRFVCPGCGKTFTYYPDFALPYKRYTRSAVTHFSRCYVQNPEATYQKAAMVNASVPGYPDGERTLAPSLSGDSKMT